MKKLAAFLTAAVAVCSALPFTASAEADEKTYIPTLYFTGEKSDSVDPLPSGILYVNTKSGKELKTSAKVFIKDDALRVGQIYAKWLWPDKYVTLSNIKDPITAGTLAPYKDYVTASDILLNDSPDQKLMGVSYANTEENAIPITGKTSDEYPMAVFDIAVDSAAEANYYDIAFKTEQPNVTNISYRLSDGSSIRDIRPSGDNAKPLTIAVSDRMLGDVNDDKTIDAKDASAILRNYALSSASQTPDFDQAQLIASDVTGDKKSDARDASKVLSYYAYTSTQAGAGTSLIDFLFME